MNLLTYEALYEIIRKEKTSEEIQKLEPSIYGMIIDYVAIKKDQMKSSEDSEKEKLKVQLQNTRKLVKELFERREKKITTLAINRSRTKEEVGTGTLLPEEKKFLAKLEGELDSYRGSVLLKLLNGTMPDYVEHGELTHAEPAELPSAPEPAGQKVLVCFTQALPVFVGPELETYGPFEAGAQASIPAEIAELLISKGKAENRNV